MASWPLIDAIAVGESAKNNEKLKSGWKSQRKLNYHNIVTAGAAAAWPVSGRAESSRVESFENRVTFHKFA